VNSLFRVFLIAMVALVSMDDPGLTILPTHREIHDYGAMSAGALLERALFNFMLDLHTRKNNYCEVFPLLF